MANSRMVAGASITTRPQVGSGTLQETKRDVQAVWQPHSWRVVTDEAARLLKAAYVVRGSRMDWCQVHGCLCKGHSNEKVLGIGLSCAACDAQLAQPGHACTLMSAPVYKPARASLHHGTPVWAGQVGCPYAQPDVGSKLQELRKAVDGIE